MDSAGIAIPYLQAIEGTGLGVRVMSIGGMQFGVPPWDDVSHLFITALKNRFINVVCIEPGMPLGAVISASQFSGANNAIAYEPPLALNGLLTVGIPNIAIISGSIPPAGKELESLKHYTAVICPTTEGTKEIVSLGIKAITIPPESDQLSRLFSGMNPA